MAHSTIPAPFLEKFYWIVPRKLYQGGWIGEWRAGVREYQITCIIDLAGIIPDPLPELRAFFTWHIPDSDELPDLTVAEGIATAAAGLITSGNAVLVQCLYGDNRSAWMAGFIIWKLGLATGDKIIEMIHNGNPDALNNRLFKEHLRSIK
ncbi:MAG: hypothetical protein HY460_00345 [Parcubacteria group bacterium]|nr:hypothetical protein [Parcubacteria group bacterium]